MYTLPILQAILITLCTFLSKKPRERKLRLCAVRALDESTEIQLFRQRRRKKGKVRGGRNSFNKYFWINCWLLLLFAKYNNKWLIMAGILLSFDWYKGERLDVVGLDKELLEIPYLLLFLGFLTLSLVPFIPYHTVQTNFTQRNRSKERRRKFRSRNQEVSSSFILLRGWVRERRGWRRRME